MINPSAFLDYLASEGVTFYSGVPDSLLKHFCSAVYERTELGRDHFIMPHEGLAVSMAAGYHLATGKIPLVYLQNSGLGNLTNPVVSLTNVYRIPVLFVVGWRGQPGTKDEPQHMEQGRITRELLDLIGVETHVIEKDTRLDAVETMLKAGLERMRESGKSAAYIVEKGAFTEHAPAAAGNNHRLNREEVIQFMLTNMDEDDLVVSTTGKISREVYDHREQSGSGHSRDFLTVGSMGHAGMIALGAALQSPGRRVWCLDGDGAALMHMGSFPLIGSAKPENLIHLVLNNHAHESVGGQPTIASGLDFSEIALACGYRSARVAATMEELQQLSDELGGIAGPVLVDIRVTMGSRNDLPRPKESPVENKDAFMKFAADA